MRGQIHFKKSTEVYFYSIYLYWPQETFETNRRKCWHWYSSKKKKEVEEEERKKEEESAGRGKGQEKERKMF